MRIMAQAFAMQHGLVLTLFEHARWVALGLRTHERAGGAVRQAEEASVDDVGGWLACVK